MSALAFLGLSALALMSIAALPFLIVFGVVAYLNAHGRADK